MKYQNGAFGQIGDLKGLEVHGESLLPECRGDSGRSTEKITGTAGSNVASTKTNRIVTVYTTKNKAAGKVSAANAVPPVANADLKSPSPATALPEPELPANSATVMADAKIPSLTPANEVQSRNATSGKSNIPFLRSDVNGSGAKSSGTVSTIGGTQCRLFWHQQMLYPEA